MRRVPLATRAVAPHQQNRSFIGEGVSSLPPSRNRVVHVRYATVLLLLLWLLCLSLQLLWGSDGPTADTPHSLLRRGPSGEGQLARAGAPNGGSIGRRWVRFRQQNWRSSLLSSAAVAGAFLLFEFVLVAALLCASRGGALAITCRHCWNPNFILLCGHSI